jgi:hypothetical protein
MQLLWEKQEIQTDDYVRNHVGKGTLRRPRKKL